MASGNLLPPPAVVYGHAGFITLAFAAALVPALLLAAAVAHLARLFTPFKRLHLRRDFEGIGLGLALCRQIARVHGGDIELQSSPGQGTRLTVRLPLWSGAEQRQPAGS